MRTIHLLRAKKLDTRSSNLVYLLLIVTTQISAELILVESFERAWRWSWTGASGQAEVQILTGDHVIHSASLRCLGFLARSSGDLNLAELTAGNERRGFGSDHLAQTHAA